MYEKSCAFLIFVFLIVFPVNAKVEPFDEAVSLGFGCQVAHQLEAHGMRRWAYPFDWFHTPFEGLLSFIANKGKGFLDSDKIHVVGVYPGDPVHLEVRDLIYGIASYHDFASSPPLSDYIAVKAKIDRRVKRFFDLLNTKKRVLFVSQYLTKVQIEQLNVTLHTLYPTLNYTLVAVGNSEEYQYDWFLEKVENYYMKDIPGDWRGNTGRWTEILRKYSVKPSFFPRPAGERW